MSKASCHAFSYSSVAFNISSVRSIPPPPTPPAPLPLASGMLMVFNSSNALNPDFAFFAELATSSKLSDTPPSPSSKSE